MTPPAVLTEPDATVFSFRRNLVVAASAGTGKTHRLTALYVLLTLGLTSRGCADSNTLAPALAPERIVATTFSRAAANEMRVRVDAALRQIAARTSSPFDSLIAARAQGEAISADEIAARAQTALAAMGAARIDTIHGLAGQMLRANALALGIPPGLRVLEEDELRDLGDGVVDDMLSDALSAGGDAEQAARGLIRACAGVVWARREIVRMLDRLDEEGLSPTELHRIDHQKHADIAKAEFLTVARDLVTDGSTALSERAREVCRTLPRADAPLSDEAAAAIRGLMTTRMPNAAKRSPSDDAFHSFRSAIKAPNNLDRADKLLCYWQVAPALAIKETAMAELLEVAHKEITRRKISAGGLGFGDVLRLCHQGIRDRPEVANAIRQSIDVLLVDEFQDTSNIQRELLYLWRESPDSQRLRGAAPQARWLSPSGLLLVGDRKQSIYGFRGADVSVFSRVAGELAGDAAGAALALPADLIDGNPSADFVALRHSYRSGPNIVAFVNAFSELDFQQGRPSGATPEPFEIQYGAVEHLEAARATSDEDRVIWIEDDGTCPERVDPLVREATGATREAFVAASYVAQCQRPFREIAILARRRSTIPLVELALGRLRIPYVVAGRALYDASEVRDLAALLRLVLDPHDPHALASVLRGPVVGLSDQTLAQLSDPKKGLAALSIESGSVGVTLGGALSSRDQRALTSFCRRYRQARAALLRMPPGEAVRASVEVFDLDAVMAHLPRAAARIGNVDRLVTLAHQRGSNLTGFVRWLDRQIDEDADEAEAVVFSAEDDAVRLTTMHGSKGLDFPVVVLMDLIAAPGGARVPIGSYQGPIDSHPDVRSAGQTPNATLIVRHTAEDGTPIHSDVYRRAQQSATDRDRAERRRLTYVAMTRARDRLVLVSRPEAPRRESALALLSEGLHADGDTGPLSPYITQQLSASELIEGAEKGLREDEISGSEPSQVTAKAPSGREADSHPSAGPPQVTIATTALSTFDGCARRYRLRYLEGLAEPVASGQLSLFDLEHGPDEERAQSGEEDPRDVGRVAHRVLECWPASLWGDTTPESDVAERLAAEGLTAGPQTDTLARGIAQWLEGPYARMIRSERATLYREELFVLPVGALRVRGAIDLCVLRGDDRIDVIDYKHRRPRADLQAYDFQLRAYALAMHRRRPEAKIRAGVLFLGSEDAPRMIAGRSGSDVLTSADHLEFSARLQQLGEAYRDARHTSEWSPLELAGCRALGCGFVTACHGGGSRSR